MYYSYYIYYENSCGHFLDEKGTVIYTDKKIKTQSDLECVKDQMIEQYYKWHKKDIDWIDVKNVSYLGVVTKKQIENDEYCIFEPIKLKQKRGEVADED